MIGIARRTGADGRVLAGVAVHESADARTVLVDRSASCRLVVVGPPGGGLARLRHQSVAFHVVGAGLCPVTVPRDWPAHGGPVVAAVRDPDRDRAVLERRPRKPICVTRPCWCSTPTCGHKPRPRNSPRRDSEPSAAYSRQRAGFSRSVPPCRGSGGPASRRGSTPSPPPPPWRSYQPPATRPFWSSEDQAAPTACGPCPRSPRPCATPPAP